MSRFSVTLTDEQFRYLFDRFPNDDNLIAAACREAIYEVPHVIPKGIWKKYNARVYLDVGFMGSGYTLVAKEDIHKIPGCMSNGYCSGDEYPNHDDIEWTNDDEVKRRSEIRALLYHWGGS